MARVWLPTRCGHCGLGAVLVEEDAYTRAVELVCVLCSRRRELRRPRREAPELDDVPAWLRAG